MTVYLPDRVMLAIADVIADCDECCVELDIWPDPSVGAVTTERVRFELGARFDLWRESDRAIIEAEAPSATDANSYIRAS